MTTVAQGRSDMAAKIGPSSTRTCRSGHGHVGNAVLQIGFTLGGETKFSVKTLQILLGRNANGFPWPCSMHLIKASAHEGLAPTIASDRHGSHDAANAHLSLVGNPCRKQTGVRQNLAAC